MKWIPKLIFKCFDPKSFAVQIQSEMDPVLLKDARIIQQTLNLM